MFPLYVSCAGEPQICSIKDIIGSHFHSETGPSWGQSSAWTDKSQNFPTQLRCSWNLLRFCFKYEVLWVPVHLGMSCIRECNPECSLGGPDLETSAKPFSLTRSSLQCNRPKSDENIHHRMMKPHSPSHKYFFLHVSSVESLRVTFAYARYSKMYWYPRDFVHQNTRVNSPQQWGPCVGARWWKLKLHHCAVRTCSIIFSRRVFLSSPHIIEMSKIAVSFQVQRQGRRPTLCLWVELCTSRKKDASQGVVSLAVHLDHMDIEMNTKVRPGTPGLDKHSSFFTTKDTLFERMHRRRWIFGRVLRFCKDTCFDGCSSWPFSNGHKTHHFAQIWASKDECVLSVWVWVQWGSGSRNPRKRLGTLKMFQCDLAHGCTRDGRVRRVYSHVLIQQRINPTENDQKFPLVVRSETTISSDDPQQLVVSAPSAGRTHFRDGWGHLRLPNYNGNYVFCCPRRQTRRSRGWCPCRSGTRRGNRREWARRWGDLTAPLSRREILDTWCGWTSQQVPTWEIPAPARASVSEVLWARSISTVSQDSYLICSTCLKEEKCGAIKFACNLLMKCLYSFVRRVNFEPSFQRSGIDRRKGKLNKSNNGEHGPEFQAAIVLQCFVDIFHISNVRVLWSIRTSVGSCSTKGWNTSSSVGFAIFVSMDILPNGGAFSRFVFQASAGVIKTAVLNSSVQRKDQGQVSGIFTAELTPLNEQLIRRVRFWCGGFGRRQ